MPDLKIQLPKGFLNEEDKILRVSSETKRLWAVVLDLLHKFDMVCAKHGLKYFAISGTLIGAARHKGFIPWDDDVDVVMRRSEYEKLLRISRQEFVHPYFLQTNETDPGSARGHAQLRNSNTTGALRSDMRNGKLIYDFNQGVFMDIFPVDNIPDLESERATFFKDLHKARLRMDAIKRDCLCAKEIGGMPMSLGRLWSALKGCAILIKDHLLRTDSLSVACERFDTLLRRYENSPCRLCAALALSQPPRKHEVFDAMDFEQSTTLPFEFLKIAVPVDYEKVLVGQYGDWKKHVVGASSHGGLFIDLDKPYTEYLRK